MGNFLQLCAVLVVGGVGGTIAAVLVPRALAGSSHAKATATRVTIFAVWAILLVIAAVFGIAMFH